MLDEALLDRADHLTEADRGGMLRALAGAGAQVRQSGYLAQEVDLDRLARTDRPRAVVVLATGIAALAGDVLVEMSGPAAPAPVIVIRDPDRLPLWVGVADAVFAVSHTGAEPNLLGALDDAVRRGAAVAGVAPRDSALEEICGRGRSPCLPTPDERPLRAALWGVLTPLLIAAQTAGLLPPGTLNLPATADLLDAVADRCRPTSESFVNPAKTLAVELAATLPVIWGGSPLAGVAARRMAQQLAGCAGVPAVSGGALPGAVHELGGLLDAPSGGTEEFFRDRADEAEPRGIRLVLLRDDDPAALTGPGWSEQVGRAALDRGVALGELAAEGTDALSRFGSLVALGDFASAYLGLASGVDPAGPRTGQQ